jgi:hypothetical protein
MALGHKGTDIGRWLTTDSPKFRKTVKASARVDQLAGVTLLAARAAAAAWQALNPDVRADLAAAMEVAEPDIEATLRATVCPHATPSCTLGCVTTTSVNAERSATQESRLAKTLLTLLHPDEAFELTYRQLAGLARQYGPDRVRWRINIADDLRYESLAPGLLKLDIPAYAYTKHPVADRREVQGVRLVYSATERWTDDDIVDTCRMGRSVAVVFDVAPSHPLPPTWHGARVVDGDVTDDLWEHDFGVIVGLRLKGRRSAIRQRLVDSGFARSVQ